MLSCFRPVIDADLTSPGCVDANAILCLQSILFLLTSHNLVLDSHSGLSMRKMVILLSSMLTELLVSDVAFEDLGMVFAIKD